MQCFLNFLWLKVQNFDLIMKYPLFQKVRLVVHPDGKLSRLGINVLKVSGQKFSKIQIWDFSSSHCRHSGGVCNSCGEKVTVQFVGTLWVEKVRHFQRLRSDDVYVYDYAEGGIYWVYKWGFELRG